MEASLEPAPVSTRHTYSPESVEKTWGIRSREPCAWAGWRQRYVRMGRGPWSPLPLSPSRSFIKCLLAPLSRPTPEREESKGLALLVECQGCVKLPPAHRTTPTTPATGSGTLVPGCGQADCPLACTM